MNIIYIMFNRSTAEVIIPCLVVGPPSSVAIKIG